MTCIIFPGLLFFPSGLSRWKSLCTEGGVFSWNYFFFESDFLTQVLSQTPHASFGARDTWLHYRSVMPPHPPSGRIRGEPGHESTAPSWLEASGATALGRCADCKVRRVAEFQTLAVSWLWRLYTLSLCLSLIASISNCPWGTIITLLSPSVALLPVLLLCSFSSAFNHQPIKSRVFSTTLLSALDIFSFFTNTTSWKLDALD